MSHKALVLLLYTIDFSTTFHKLFLSITRLLHHVVFNGRVIYAHCKLHKAFALYIDGLKWQKEAHLLSCRHNWLDMLQSFMQNLKLREQV